MDAPDLPADLFEIPFNDNFELDPGAHMQGPDMPDLLVDVSGEQVREHIFM